MAYRNLLALRDANGEGVRVDRADLGPARAGATITDRVAAHLKEADRLVDDQLAPAALLSPRFSVLPQDQDAVELDRLLGYFSQFPRLPKLASDDVLRRALVSGASGGHFALVSGTSWDADDAVIRFREHVDPSEVVFQPGTWVVRARAAEGLLARRQPGAAPESQPGDTQMPGPRPHDEGEDTTGATGTAGNTRQPDGEGSDSVAGVTVSMTGVPSNQIREVVKSAILPLATHAEVRVDLSVNATGGQQGIPRQTLDLVVAEALRQLGLEARIDEHDQE
jgi:hypothetical protein